jgi:hypothetical protein
VWDTVKGVNPQRSILLVLIFVALSDGQFLPGALHFEIPFFIVLSSLSNIEISPGKIHVVIQIPNTPCPFFW